MPIFGFTCEDCERTVDIIQKFDDPNPPCPSCHSKEPMKRQVSCPSFRLKGDGWYETDFKHK